MNNLIAKIGSVTLALMLVAFYPAYAQVLFNFSNSVMDTAPALLRDTMSSTYQQTIDGITIQLSVFSPNDSNLYQSQSGITTASYTENDFIEVSLSGSNVSNITGMSIEFTSDIGNPSVLWGVWTVNSNNTLGTFVNYPISETTMFSTLESLVPLPPNPFAVAAADSGGLYLTAIELDGNFMNMSVPEPTTMAVLGSTLALAALRKRLSKK